MVYPGGVPGWCFRVVYRGGVPGWCILVVCLGGVSGWCTRVVYPEVHRGLPVEQRPLAEEQLHHLGVALLGGQVQRCEPRLVALVHQPGVRDGLQEAVAGIDPPVPDGEKEGGDG